MTTPQPFRQVVLSGDVDRAILEMQGIEDRMRQKRELLSRTLPLLRRAAADRFKTGGPGWAPNAASTIAAKQDAGLPALTKKGNIPWRLKQNGGFGGANSILIRRGDLRDSYVRKGAKGHVEQIDEKDGTASIGSTLPYAAIHQQGADPYVIIPKAGKVLAFIGAGGKSVVTRKPIHHPGIPARPVLLTQDDARTIAAMAQDYIINATAAAQPEGDII